MGALTGLAKGETIYSARFMGDMAYLVTFEQVDPLFALDLSDPSAPVVLGELKIPGYSGYLHPYDENHLIGVGKEVTLAKTDWSTEPVPLNQGVKISLFDTSDKKNPVEVYHTVIGDRGSECDVIWNHKAFLFKQEKNLLVLPMSVYTMPKRRPNPPKIMAFLPCRAAMYSLSIRKRSNWNMWCAAKPAANIRNGPPRSIGIFTSAMSYTPALPKRLHPST